MRCVPVLRRRRLVAALLLSACPPPGWPAPASAADDEAFTGIRGTVLRFATVEQGRAVLGADDLWIERTSDFQRAKLMGREPPVDRAAFRAFQAEAVRPWAAADRARWQAALRSIAPALDRLQLPWPAEVLLVRTDGSESDTQPHTRANAVVLPIGFEAPGFSDEEVLAHELYHVMSRHNPALQTRLYALIGYEAVPELEWPAAWLPRRIADQDAPVQRHAMTLTLRGRSLRVMPVVIAVDGAAAMPGLSLLGLMSPRLLELQDAAAGEPTRALLHDGLPLWRDIDKTPEFLQRLGGNTDYNLDPEETIADNVMFLISGRRVKNPALLRRIEAVLRSAGNRDATAQGG